MHTSPHYRFSTRTALTMHHFLRSSGFVLPASDTLSSYHMITPPATIPPSQGRSTLVIWKMTPTEDCSHAVYSRQQRSTPADCQSRLIIVHCHGLSIL